MIGEKEVAKNVMDEGFGMDAIRRVMDGKLTVVEDAECTISKIKKAKQPLRTVVQWLLFSSLSMKYFCWRRIAVQPCVLDTPLRILTLKSEKQGLSRNEVNQLPPMIGK